MNATAKLITEWTNFEYDPKIIKEQKEKGQPLIMKGILQKAETLNQNGRIYPKVILEREIRKYERAIEKKLIDFPIYSTYLKDVGGIGYDERRR